MMLFGQALLLSFFLLGPLAVQAETPVYRNPRAPLEERVRDALVRLSLPEKIDFLSGDESGFATKPNLRLGIPSIQMTDGPLGVRSDRPTTAFPSGISMAATFNPELVRQVARAMGEETKSVGRDMLLGPCIDISRNPFGGRNFESLGEDPYLTSQLVRGYLEGLRSQRVISSTKHFAMNDQEYKRMSINVIADERTMHEIHLPAFHEAVKAGTFTIMAAYNKINGSYASENSYLLTEILKKKWGFKGFVVSDWGATHSTVLAANAGLDLEMPSTEFFGERLLQAVTAGQVNEATINDKVSRILRVIFASGLFDNNSAARPDPSVIGSEEHLKLARKMAQESIVLLKNRTSRGEAILPIKAGRGQHFAVIGAGAYYPRISGGGSSMVNPTKRVRPLDVLRERTRGSADLQYAIGVRLEGDFEPIPTELLTLKANGSVHGLTAEYFNNMNLEGAPAVTQVDREVNFDFGLNAPAPGIRSEQFSIRWTGFLTPPTTGDFDLIVRCDDGARLFIDDEKVLDKWFNQGDTVYTVRRHLEAGRPYKIRMEYYQDGGGAVAGLGFASVKTKEIEEAVALAKRSDLVLLFAGTSSNFESEGGDRKNIALPDNQDELIHRVASANPRTVVIINAGNPVTMPWLKEVAGVVYAWFPGQEGAEAVSDMLFGKVNPSGKLPVSFPKRWEDASAYGFYPEDPGMKDQVTYREGIYVGYRHFDAKRIEPLFPFGFGLSYTNFRYSNLHLQAEDSSSQHPKMELSFDLTNTGLAAGAESAQLYVSEIRPSVHRPRKELKAFEKVALNPGETKRVTLHLERSAFSFYDTKIHDWNANPGEFSLRIGGSSRNLPLKTSVWLGR